LRRLFLVGVFLLCLGLSPAALASTVSKSGATVTYTAQVSEGNNLTVTVSGSNFVFSEAADGTPVTIQDTDVGGCISFGSNTANCPTSGVTQIVVFLRDLNDTVSLSTISIAVTLNGEDGNDTLTGGSGADSLDGGAGNDTLVGNAGGDSFASTAGNDSATGGTGNDVFNMGSAADGADVFTGDAGTDTANYSARATALTITLWDTTANDGAAGETDDLRYVAPSGFTGTANTIEIVQGGSANDTITGSRCGNTLQGGGGNDVLNGQPDSGGACAGAAVTITDNDTLEGGTGNDTLNGLSGNDTLRGGSGADVFNGGAHGSFLAAGGDTADYSLESSSARSVSLNGVADDGVGSEADNVMPDVEDISGGPGNDTLTGDADANVLNGNGGDDVLDGGTGADSLNGGGGGDRATYAGRSSAVTADNDGVADDGASGEADNISTDVEAISGGSGADVLTGGPGADGLFGGPGNDTMNGLGGGDRLQGDDGQDTLNGGDDGDSISGADNNDILNGNGGNDTLDGNDGADTVNAGLGNDVINNLPDGNSDAFFGNEGIDGIGFYWNSSCFGGPPCRHITVTLDDDADDGISGGGDNVHSDIENVTLSDLTGGYGNDTIVGDADANILNAGRGNDTITGGSGNDTLIGGSEGDTLNGGVGSDLLQGGDGPDNLNGGDSNDTMDGGGGGDVYAGGPGSSDNADYSARTNPINVSFNGAADDGEAGEGDNLTSDVERVDGGSGNDTIVGGRNLGLFNFSALNHFNGNGGNDTLDGGDLNDQLFGGTGNDTLLGSAHTDILGGDSGDDTLDGGLQLDIIDGGDGLGDTVDYSSRSAAVSVNLNVAGGDGQAGESDDVQPNVEHIRGGSGADTLVGHGANNRLTGGPGNDVLTGNAGNDTLDGGANADVFNGGDGIDLADYSNRSDALTLDADGAADDGAAGENDRIQTDVEHLRGGTANDLFPAGSAPDGADRFSGSAGVDTVDYSARSGGVKVHKGFGQDGEAGEGDTVEADVENIRGGSGNDQIDGTADANLLLGNAGDDVISAGSGDDRVDGGPGGDTMTGGVGSDILDYSARTAPLFLTLAGGANDGEAGEGDNAAGDFDVVFGGSGNDRMTGSSIQNILRGEGGNDVLDGAGANDTLLGGLGDDRLLGGLGGVAIDNDDLVGEDGTDTADYSARSGALTIDADDDDDDGGAGEGDNVWASTENILGGSGNDSLTGNSSANFLRGNGGTDTLFGLGGDDVLHVRDANAESPDCGDGTADQVETDAGDTPVNCETENERAFDPPVNSAAPAITGTPDVGQTLTATNGTWTGLGPMTFAYQWQNGGGATWNDIAGANANTYVVAPSDSGKQVRLVVTASNDDGDALKESNATALIQPALLIGDVSVVEGNTGAVDAVFTVSLSSAAPAGGVDFTYTTANGSAVAGLDYTAAGAVAAEIPAGQSEVTVAIPVSGDTLDESNETFTVTIAGVTNASVLDGAATGTITDDDPAPTLRVNNVSITEGNSGTKTLKFTVRLSTASGKTITVRYATANGTARAGSDYNAKSKTLTFLPGQTTKTVGVAVRGDRLNEANETFFLKLSSLVNATFADRVGRATIVDND
jgi:Ca2+-binding RTX toxin-like protein